VFEDFIFFSHREILFLYFKKQVFNIYMYIYIFIYLCTIFFNVIKQYKAMPLQAWTGPEGSRRLRLPDFETIGT